MESSSKDRRELLIEAAIFYAGLGWPVLPLLSADKRPLGALVPHGLKDATTDISELKRFWSVQPDANVGVRTGADSELVVLDVDPRHGGNVSLAWLQSSTVLPRTDYKLADRVTIRVEQKFIVLRSLKLGKSESNTPELPRRAGSHPTGEKYRTKPNKIVDGGCEWTIERVI